MKEDKQTIKGVYREGGIDSSNGTENWDRFRDQAVLWMGHGKRIETIALLQDRNALLEYVGDDNEKVMQWIGDNLDTNCPNQYMIGDIAIIVDDWVLRKIKADVAVNEVLSTLESYIGGC